MQKIYIARPGAQKEGPYTLEQINRDLAAKKINDTEFWAWHEGLPTWQPLYTVPGVTPMAGSTVAQEPIPRPLTSKAAPESGARQIKPEANNSNSHPVPAPAANAAPGARGTSLTAPTIELNAEQPRAKAEHAVLNKPQPVTARIAPEHTAAPVKPAPISPTVETATPRVTKPEPVQPKSEGKTAPLVKPESPSHNAEPATFPVPITDSEKPEALAATTDRSEPATLAAEWEPKAAREFTAPSMFSGKSFAALEQIFVFTTGEGPAAFKSEITTAMLSEAVGEKLEIIRSKVPVDVVGGTNANVLEAIRAGAFPGSAWRTLFKIKPAVAQQTQDGLFHLCVRTFPVESKELVALLLLYHKHKAA